MAAGRTAIPKKTRDAVLAEYRHRCAMCGGDKPQLHHIDGDTTNHDPTNLLPLCPNCHLSDQHDPTAPADPGKLRLFRQYKDPTILGPQFQPLYERLAFLGGVSEEASKESLREAAQELVQFVAALEMGGFYAEKLEELVMPDAEVFISWLGGGWTAEDERRARESEAAYREKLHKNKGAALALAVELLRYQPWRRDDEAR